MYMTVLTSPIRDLTIITIITTIMAKISPLMIALQSSSGGNLWNKYSRDDEP